METAQKELTAKEAIAAAFKYFNEYFEGQLKRRILLEGLEYLEGEDQWMVAIGFDSGGEKKTGAPGVFGDVFGGTTTEPIKEIREFIIDANTGDFVRMSGG